MENQKIEYQNMKYHESANLKGEEKTFLDNYCKLLGIYGDINNFKTIDIQGKQKLHEYIMYLFSKMTPEEIHEFNMFVYQCQTEVFTRETLETDKGSR